MEKTPQTLQDLAKNVFTDSVLKSTVSEGTYTAFKNTQKSGKAMPKKEAGELADALRDWAMSKGCVTYAHWFSPMRGRNGEKHDTFVDLNYKTGEMKVDFGATALFFSETDGSSFPNGGMRQTHTAAAYTSWDTSSPPFVRDDCLYIPASFISWKGDALDLKTPLLRANQYLSKQATRVLNLIGDKETTSVVSNVGWEQEFFVIDREHYLKRPDLINTGRTLIGALPPLDQQTEKHYFGKMNKRVRAFLREAQKEMLALDISFHTLHNEVAPSQHEISPIFTLTNKGSDQNVVAMEVLEDVAIKHGLVCLLHEKPFANINGSGKHNNWGLNTNTGANLYHPGKTDFENERFIVFVTALARALDVHGDIIRVGIANAGNDHRLGAQEAPPAIISLYTGPNMEKHLKSIINGGDLKGYSAKTEELDFGVESVVPMNKNAEDRNRTAPFPFCGNRFEFRAVGSTQNIAWPLAMVNTAVSESLCVMADALESGKSIKDVVKETLTQHMRVIFNGNGYSSEWPIEATKRGLWNLPQTVDALAVFNSDKNQKLFEKTKVFTKHELECRTEIEYENYIKAIQIEANCLSNMMNQAILPSCAKDLKNLENSSSKTVKQLFEEKDELYFKLFAEAKNLQNALSSFPEEKELKDQATYAAKTLKTHMNTVRQLTDSVEKVLPTELYPYPNYEQILYDHHSQ
eukprot:gene7958-12424_t